MPLKRQLAGVKLTTKKKPRCMERAWESTPSFTLM